MIQADAVKAVFQCQYALDFMGLDHRSQYIAHGERRLALRDRHPAQVIRGSQDPARLSDG